MEERFLGDAIRHRRLELGLTQEQLCEGICEPITISRLENGKQTPSRSRINALLERLDMPADRYYALLNQKEIDVAAAQRKVTLLNLRFSQAVGEKKRQVREQALQAHRDLEALAGPDDRLSRQQILRSKAILGKEDGPYSQAEEQALLLEAIRLTSPSFDPDNIGKGLYTKNEIKIINQLALSYVYRNQHMEAIEIYSQLFKYIRKHFQKIPPTQGCLTLVAFNYSRELGMIHQYEKAIEIAEIGRQVCLDYDDYSSMPGLLSVLAESWHYLGDDEKSRDLYYQTYYLCKVIGDDDNAQATLADAKAQLGIDLSHQLSRDEDC